MTLTTSPSAVIWFRNDLRLHDNSAVYHALDFCRQHKPNQPLIAVFFITEKQWKEHQLGNNKVNFLLRSLKSLSEALKEREIPLLIETCPTFSKIPNQLLKICQHYHTNTIFWNDEYAWDEQQRDTLTQKILTTHHIQCKRFHDDVLIPPGKVLTKQGKFFSVFTPFKRAILKQLEEVNLDLKPLPRKLSNQPLNIINNPDDIITQTLNNWPCTLPPDLWPTGEKAAKKSLHAFINKKITIYHDARDYPYTPGTSQISQHLAVGSLSIKQCLSAAIHSQNHSISNIMETGVSTWVSELIWREFYRHILIGFPWVNKHQPFKPEYSAIPWRYNENDFFAWQNGKTGYPIVDAAMTQLNTTGWMHNRLRMISAMFLSKHLLIDWRWGEAYFLQKLVDADFASNNGGWQWSASTGADAAPYFRIFNPYLQAQKFDTQGEFIANQLPELSVLNPESRLKPSAIEADAQGYPQPIIEHDEARNRAKSVFSTALSNLNKTATTP